MSKSLSFAESKILTKTRCFLRPMVTSYGRLKFRHIYVPGGRHKSPHSVWWFWGGAGQSPHTISQSVFMCNRGGGSPLPGAVLCMGGAPMTKVVLKVPLLCSTPCSFFASQPHAIYLPCVIFRIYNVLYEVFDLCYVKSLFCVVWRLYIVLCEGFCMCYVNCSPNGLAALRRARFARFASVQHLLRQGGWDYVHCSPNGLAALRRARFARCASLQRPYIHIYIYIQVYIWRFLVSLVIRKTVKTASTWTLENTCTDASERSEPGEAQRARLDCNSHKTC